MNSLVFCCCFSYLYVCVCLFHQTVKMKMFLPLEVHHRRQRWWLPAQLVVAVCCYFQFTDVTFNINSPLFYSALICFHEVYQNNPPYEANHPPKRIKILKQKMVRPTTEAREWGVGCLGETFTKCKIYGGQEKMKHSDLSSPVCLS